MAGLAALIVMGIIATVLGFRAAKRERNNKQSESQYGSAKRNRK